MKLLIGRGGVTSPMARSGTCRSIQELVGQPYNTKNLAYYGVLYLHDFHLLGPLFFSFLFLGLFRNYIWKGDKGGNRQLAFLLSYSVLVAAVFAVVLIHRYSPMEGSEDEEEIEAVDEVQEGATDDKA